MRGFLDDKTPRDDGVERAELVDLELRLLRQSAAAWLVTDGVVEAWLPMSKVERNGDGTWTLPRWMAIDRLLLGRPDQRQGALFEDPR